MSFRDKSRENNCEILERESGSRYMSNLGQVSVVITERTGTQCLIAAFHPFYSPLLLFAYTYPAVTLRLSLEGHSSPGNGTKKHLSLI